MLLAIMYSRGMETHVEIISCGVVDPSGFPQIIANQLFCREVFSFVIVNLSFSAIHVLSLGFQLNPF
jgi:hypothetical protein